MGWYLTNLYTIIINNNTVTKKYNISSRFIDLNSWNKWNKLDKSRLNQLHYRT